MKDKVPTQTKEHQWTPGVLRLGNVEGKWIMSNILDNNKVTQPDEKPVTIFYPEILLFVPWKSYPNNALTLMVRHFIVYFNGIDMLMSKLSTDNIKIHLNLAGIVFEESRDLFGFMIPIDITVPSDEDPPEKIRYIDCQSTSELVSEYINTNKDTFPDDSFDFYFIPSRTDSWWTAKNIEACGISLINDNYAERWWSNNHKSGIIIHHGNPCEYVTAAHEIAHLMNIKHESQKKGYSDGITQCYAIMQETNPFCPDCLKWTNQNIEDLQKFSKYK
ncbi:hypothetical protein PV327_002926 [Microctonus hyperodae]|uniref:Uncharacterized protein n=1 Tax=Microctonus hyperodae TaxID=165561 RepID=A0AA39G3A8_MICHY|nr:hypothetical protein PV327_002926 [Microctonus hyperodae]